MKIFKTIVSSNIINELDNYLDDEKYNNLYPNEQKIIAKAYNSENFKAYILGAFEALELSEVKTSSTFKEIITLVTKNWFTR